MAASLLRRHAVVNGGRALSVRRGRNDLTPAGGKNDVPRFQIRHGPARPGHLTQAGAATGGPVCTTSRALTAPPEQELPRGSPAILLQPQPPILLIACCISSGETSRTCVATDQR